MKIISTATVFPKHYYRQQEIAGFLGEYWRDELDSREAMERFHRNAKVGGRHFAIPLEDLSKLKNWGEANDVFIQQAVELGESAVRKALDMKGIPASAIGAIIFVSITGIANPSIDARLMNRIDFSRNIKRIPIFGLGCVGGAAGIARAADYLKAYPEQMALLLSVELCSLTWQREDLSNAHIISTALFGDGAAAVVLCGAQCSFDGPKIIASQSVFYDHTEDVMGWNIRAEGFKVMLSSEVPNVVLKNLRRDVDQFLGQNDLSIDDIGLWIMHTGGPKVLEAIESALDLSPDALDFSWACLNEVGNLSSASVLAVLDRIMQQPPQPGTWGVLSAMGPGFCSEMVLMRW